MPTPVLPVFIVNAMSFSRCAWVIVWRMALWARLTRGGKAHFMAETLFQYGLFPNLFGASSVFEIDGNSSYVADVSEM